jgi:hypothetical protein
MDRRVLLYLAGTLASAAALTLRKKANLPQVVTCGFFCVMTPASKPKADYDHRPQA